MTVLILVTGSFFATNVDNLLLLVGWMLDGRTSIARLAAAYAIAVIAVLVVSLALGMSANLIPVDYIGYLGLVPIFLGVKLIADQLRHRSHGPPRLPMQNLPVAAITATLFANSVDTMLVFAPLFADSNANADHKIAAVYLITALAWFLFARVFSQRAGQVPRVAAVAQWLTPLVMIAIGFYILDNTLSDVVPDI